MYTTRQTLIGILEQDITSNDDFIENYIDFDYVQLMNVIY